VLILGLKLQKRLDELTVLVMALQIRKGSKHQRDGLPDEGDKDAKRRNVGSIFPGPLMLHFA
jgi:hypothetical protein